MFVLAVGWLRVRWALARSFLEKHNRRLPEPGWALTVVLWVMCMHAVSHLVVGY